MINPHLTLRAYQVHAARTDRTIGSGDPGLPVLGLFGEIGSLLSEVKKKQRDARSYVGYEESVTEEMGDVLWYLTTIGNRAGLSLTNIALRANGQMPASDDAVDFSFSALQPQAMLALNTPTTAFEGTLISLASEAGRLVDAHTQGASGEALEERLAALFGMLVRAANEAGITLEAAANYNLQKIEDRWPQERIYPALFDESFPHEEQLPRSLVIEIYERTANNGRNYVLQRCNGILIGDRITDNIMKPDDYRFHDVFHYAYATILGWSPVTRALFRLKRKSETKIDEGQDSARAVILEEGIAAYLFGRAKELDFFAGHDVGDMSFTLLKSVRQFVRGYEPEVCPLWLWEQAILRGNEAFRFLREHRCGRLVLNLRERSFLIEPLPQ